MNAQERIREARKLERKMGLTIYEQAKNTTTGNDVFVPKATIGIPHGVTNKEAATTIGLTLLAVYGSTKSLKFLRLAETTLNKELKKERKRKAMTNAAIAGLSVFTLMPINIDAQKFSFLNPMKYSPL